MKRKLVIAAAVIVALVLVAAIALPLLIDVDEYRAELERRAEERLGRDVELGEVDLALWPSVGLEVHDVAIGARPDEGEGQMLAVARVHAGAPLLPLLRGKLEIRSIDFDAPTINLVRMPDGSWNVTRMGASDDPGEAAEPTPAADSGDADGGAPPAFAIDVVRFRGATVEVRDAGASEPILRLEDLDLTIDDVALDRPIGIVLETAIAGMANGRLSLEAEVGPLTGDAPLALKGKLRTTELDVAALRGGAGDMPPVTASIDFDVARDRADGALTLNRVGFNLDGRSLALTGEIGASSGGVRPLHITVQPTQLQPSDMTALAGLAGQQVTFSGSQPLSLEATVRGAVGGDAGLDIAAQVQARELTIGHPKLGMPIEDLTADIALVGDKVRVQGLKVKVGASDLAGSIQVEGLSSPAVEFELTSNNLAFKELTSIVVRDETAADAAGDEAAADGGAGGGGEAAAGLRADGSLRVARGTFSDKVAFSDLAATAKLAGGVFTLDPVSMQMYDGSFEGRAVRDLRGDGDFELEGKVADIDLGALLTSVNPKGALFRGRLSGQLEATGAGSDYETIVRSLTGGGSIRAIEGQTALVNVFDSLSGVAGMFGANSLALGGDAVKTAGTPFNLLDVRFQMADGKANLETVTLESPLLNLGGRAVVDLISNDVDGTFEVQFSEGLSEKMREDGSKAAELFFDPQTDRVELPFSLSGGLAAPKASVDWAGAAKGVAKRKGMQLLGDALDGDGEEGSDSGVSGLVSGLFGGGGNKKNKGDGGDDERSASGGGASAAAHGMKLTITKTRFKGAFLVKHLYVEGKVSGAARASLTVRDAGGKTLKTIDSIGDVGSGKKSFKVKVDGKYLALGRSPFTVEVTAFDAAGQSLTASEETDG